MFWTEVALTLEGLTHSHLKRVNGLTSLTDVGSVECNTLSSSTLITNIFLIEAYFENEIRIKYEFTNIFTRKVVI